MKIDSQNNIWFSDRNNFRVCKIGVNDTFYCVAGNGVGADAGLGGPALLASIYIPSGVTLDRCKNLYISDDNDALVLVVTYDSVCNRYTTHTLALNTAAVSIFPNPAFSELHITGLTEPNIYSICNTQGNVIQTGNLAAGDQSVFITSLPVGMYFMVLTDEKGFKTVQKIIKE